jgi:DNA-binding transcriptional LysR family regulator
LDQLLRDIDGLVRGPLGAKEAERVMSISANDGFIDTFAAPIVAAAYRTWPQIKIRFAAKHAKAVESLRDGDVDIEIGVLGNSGPEIVMTKLFDDRMIAVVRKGHPLSKGAVTMGAYLAFPHISVSRKGLFHGPIDGALSQRGLTRNVIAVVPNFSSALELARHSDWIAHVPERHTVQSRKGSATFKIPIATPGLAISMMWHPRLDGDHQHKSLRKLIVRVCRQP